MTPRSSSVPAVSVVIPTIGRPTLARAVTSALEQNIPVAEVLVCSDTESPLEIPRDGRVRVIHVGPQAGGNAARQAGIAEASGDLIALLDDDDYWEDFHLDALLCAVADQEPRSDAWVAATRGLLPDGRTYPQRLRRRQESLIDYLFVLSRTLRGKGALPTSTLLFPSSLGRRVPWRTEMRFHQDLTWFLDLEAEEPRLEIIQSPRPTAWLDDTIGSVTKGIPVRASVLWAEKLLKGRGGERRPDRPFADFLLSRYPLRAAAARGNWWECISLFALGLRHRPSPWAVLYSLAYGGRALGIRGRSWARAVIQRVARVRN